MWASETLTKWHGKVKPISKNRNNFMKLQSGTAIGIRQHLAIIDDSSIDGMTRATTLELLRYSEQSVSRQWLDKYLKAETDLLRLSAVSAANSVVMEDRIELLTPLLSDPVKAIRIASAHALVGGEIAEVDIVSFIKLFLNY